MLKNANIFSYETIDTLELKKLKINLINHKKISKLATEGSLAKDHLPDVFIG